MSAPLQSLLDALFPRGHRIDIRDSVLTGTATTDDGEVTVIGTTDRIEVGVDHALALAGTVLASTAAHPQRSIVMLADTAGQRRRGAMSCWASTATSRISRRLSIWPAAVARVWSPWSTANR